MSSEQRFREFMDDVADDVVLRSRAHAPAPDFAEVMARAEAMRASDSDAARPNVAASSPRGQTGPGVSLRLADGPASDQHRAPVAASSTTLGSSEPARTPERHAGETPRVSASRRETTPPPRTDATAEVISPPRGSLTRLWIWIGGAAAAFLLAVELPPELAPHDSSASPNLTRFDREHGPDARPAKFGQGTRRRSPSPSGTQSPDPAEATSTDDESQPQQLLESELPSEVHDLALVTAPTTNQRSHTAARDTMRSSRRRHRGDPSPTTKDPRSSLDERLRGLDAQAEFAWTSGRRDEAASLYHRIIKLGPQTRWAQLAYGDLFTLRRQAGDRAGETKLWQAYLHAYPTGLHADEARAGLCQREQSSKQSACWRQYVADFPRGSSSSQARRELDHP